MLADDTGVERRPEVETPSGKDQEDENFPVASILLSKRYRKPVKTFYDFARAADDVADNPKLSGDEKVSRLNVFEAVLTAALDAPELGKASRLRVSLQQSGVTDKHARDLLTAFRTDAHKARYASWQELLDYCEVSANPVGRFLLDLHGEDKRGYAHSDALCTVLQVLNHLQDCGDDKRNMDRVYIPADWMCEFGTSDLVLDAVQSDAGFRAVLDRMLDRCDELIDSAALLPARLANTRFAINSATIICLARRLSRRLRHGDPLAAHVALTKSDFVLAILNGIVWGLTRRRPHAAKADPRP